MLHYTIAALVALNLTSNSAHACNSNHPDCKDRLLPGKTPQLDCNAGQPTCGAVLLAAVEKSN